MSLTLRAAARILRPYQRDSVEQLKRFFPTLLVSLKGYVNIAPGGGKTLVAVTFLVEHLMAAGAHVLWLAWDWALLEHAHRDLTAQYEFQPTDLRLARVGDHSELPGVGALPDLTAQALASRTPILAFATMQSFSAQLRSGTPLNFKPNVIIIDESHYGIDGRTERAILNFADQHCISILGLTGTPKLRTGWREAATPVPFADLVRRGHLARPEVERVATNRQFRGTLASRSSLVSEQTYGEIAEDHARNSMIVSHYHNHHQKFGKAIVFACNKEHADRLGALFAQQYPTVVIHSGIEDAKTKIEQFRASVFRIAVGVRMLSQGIDVPDVKSVFLCGPTTSDIAFFQMICRGARLADGKTSFHVVDFVDTFQNPRFASLLVNSASVFLGAGNSGGNVAGPDTTRTARPNLNYHTRHRFEPRPTLSTLRYDETAPFEFQVLDGLRICDTQTFGIEFELTSPGGSIDWSYDRRAWKTVASRLLEFLRTCLGAGVASQPAQNPYRLDYGVWNVTYDASCGWEMVTPILRGREGFEDVALVLSRMESDGLLDELGLGVNVDTGTHIHLGWRYGEAPAVRRLLRWLRQIEPALSTLVSPSRVTGARGREYCASWRRQASDSRIADIRSIPDVHALIGGNRYRSVNICGMRDEPQTLEVRLHNGTVDAAKILTWVSLWQNILWSIHHGALKEESSASPPPEIPLPTHMLDGDIVWLAWVWLGLGSDFRMLERLHSRRSEVVGNRYWRQVLGDERVTELLREWDACFRELMEWSV